MNETACRCSLEAIGRAKLGCRWQQLLGRDVECMKWSVAILGVRRSLGGDVVMQVAMFAGTRYWGVGDEKSLERNFERMRRLVGYFLGAGSRLGTN